MAFPTIQAALATTEAMLDCARDEQWDAVLALGERHAEVIARLRADTDTLQNPDCVPELEQLERLTRQLAEAVAPQRDALSQSLRGLHKGRRATRAYGGR